MATNDFNLGAEAAAREYAILEALNTHQQLSFYRIRVAVKMYPNKLGIAIEDLLTMAMIERVGSDKIDPIAQDYKLTPRGKACLKHHQRRLYHASKGKRR